LTGLLLDNRHEVIVVDNLSTGKISNILGFLDLPNFKFIQLDICDRNGLVDAFEDIADIDWVFHLAALAEIVPSIENPESYFDSNVLGTLNIVQLAIQKSVKKLIYAASSSCYGIPDKFPTDEYSVCDPKYPYALTKYLGEQVVMHWNLVFGLPAISLRLFNVYGLRTRTSGTYGAVFGVFLAQKLAGEPFTIVGDGSQTRDFTFVADVCKAFKAAAESNISGEIMNVGSGNTYSVNELVRLLGGPAVYIPKRPGEPDCTFADIEKIKRSLNWIPTVNLETGVNIMIENINEWKDAPLWDSLKIELATKSWFKHLGNNRSSDLYE
jgi:UDP-glucose 4-epimerase